jgi:hypothetical protein
MMLQLLEQRHATVSAPVHLPVRTAAYDAFGSCTSVGCLYLASSFARRKTSDIKEYNNWFLTRALCAHLVTPTAFQFTIRGQRQELRH